MAKVGGRGGRFPIVETFGFPYDSTSDLAVAAKSSRACPFTKKSCEKYRQYGYGYCSVTYLAEWDDDWRTYAVCDHRLDEVVVDSLRHHFGQDLSAVTLVPEVQVQSSPRLNIDYVAFRYDPSFEAGVDAIAIETQAIDLRGGGVGPAWRAWEEGAVPFWRDYFSEEAQIKGRKDTVDYGINMGNVYKRLGSQIADKGAIFSAIDVPLFVIVQDVVYRQFKRRVQFKTLPKDARDQGVIFMSYDYDENGSGEQLALQPRAVERATFADYVEGLRRVDSRNLLTRANLVEMAERKGRLTIRPSGQ